MNQETTGSEIAIVGRAGRHMSRVCPRKPTTTNTQTKKPWDMNKAMADIRATFATYNNPQMEDFYSAWANEQDKTMKDF